ncbi:MAG: hypothetical protein QF415_15540 [Candidatus Undinarchaeales archaeon]|jgi:hypothetical protein|nr:hypothetical protein [Candidatus Undinarchaeales archaeon]MDP7493212.1 hypothetical protein [Candidatus Undinarchaeales archaeon]
MLDQGMPAFDGRLSHYQETGECPTSLNARNEDSDDLSGLLWEDLFAMP